MSRHHLLVIGAGSAGKRHASNFSDLGCRFSAVDVQEDPREEAAEIDGHVSNYENLDQAIQDIEQFDAAVVATPPKYHADHVISLLEHEVPIFLEKPLCKTYEEALEIQDAWNEADVPFLLGYSFRWMNSLIDARRMIHEEINDPIYHGDFIMAEYLPDWHPWEDYRDFYMASKDLGGGALLDDSHWIDLAMWFFGVPDSVYAEVDQITDLEISSDDHVELLLRYKQGLRIRIHLDLYSRPHENQFKIVGNNETLKWSLEDNEIRMSEEQDKIWDATEYKKDPTHMYVNEAEHFIDVLEGDASPKCTVNDGVDVMSIIRAARESNETKSVVEIQT